MSIYLLIPQAFLIILWIYCLYAVLNPKKTVQFTIDRNMRAMEFYGFKATMKPTRKSEGKIRNGHLAVLAIITAYILLIFFFGNEFMVSLFYR